MNQLNDVLTLCALNNFRIRSMRIHHALITAYAKIKKVTVETSVRTDALEPELDFAKGLKELGFIGASKRTKHALERGKIIAEILQEDKKQR